MFRSHSKPRRSLLSLFQLVIPMVIVTKLNDDTTQATSRPYLESGRQSLTLPSYDTITSPAVREGSTVQMMQHTRSTLIQDYYDNLSAARIASPTYWSASSLSALSSLRSTQPPIRRAATSARKSRRLAVLLAGTLLFISVLLAIGRHGLHQGWWILPPPIWRIAHGAPKPGLTIPELADGSIVEQFSTAGSNWTRVPREPFPDGLSYSSQLALELPLRDSHGYYFILRGNASSGDIQVNEGAPGNAIRVDITVRYTVQKSAFWRHEHVRMFKMARAYLLERYTNETGVGLYLPVANDQPDIQVSITIPRSQERSTRLRSLEIDSTQLNAQITLKDGVAIDNLKVAARTVHSKAAFETISSSMLAYRDIEGPYSAREQLRLEVTDTMGALRAESFLGRDAPADFTPSLELYSPGTIGGSVTLLDANRFKVRIGNHQYRYYGAENIYYSVESLPVNAILDLEARVRGGNMELRVPPTYHGSLDLCKARPDADPVRVAHGLRDPTGAGAQHIISPNWSDDRRWSGSVRWGSSESRGGAVRLFSTDTLLRSHCRLSIS